MSLGASDIARLTAGGAPVLMLDTCALLDVVRDVTRKEAKGHLVRAAVSILDAAEQGRLELLIADQVRTELNANLQGVQEEASAKLTKFLKQVEEVSDIAAVYGAVGSVAAAHLSDHVVRARAILDRLLPRAMSVSPGPEVAQRAFHRVSHAVLPSRPGKESMKDCHIIETYLETAAQLRQAGFSGHMVFGSSNTDDYHDKGTNRLHQSLAAEFAAFNLEYGSNFGSMRHLLGV